MTKAEKFNEWMLKIRNIYYSDNNQMTKAYEQLRSVEGR
jgi:hypothetical protein